jgi:hypothetical protein
MEYITEIEEITLKFIWEHNSQKCSNQSLEKRAKDITVSDLKLYYRAIATKITWCWHTHTHTHTHTQRERKQTHRTME